METFLFVTVGWVFSVCLHEYGHAIVAYKGGDHTVKEKGYLSFNPIHYTHPVYSFVMPLVFLMLGGLGLPGGAVYINDHLLRSKWWRTGVSLAGPAINVVLIIVLCLPFVTGLLPSSEESVLACALAFLIQLEICAVLFNLLPIPPLDGFQALEPWLPAEVGEQARQYSNTIFFVVILLFWNVPALNHALWSAVFTISSIVGVDPRLGWEGWQAFRFWKT